MKKSLEAKKQALADIREELARQGKCFISVSVRQLREYGICRFQEGLI